MNAKMNPATARLPSVSVAQKTLLEYCGYWLSLFWPGLRSWSALIKILPLASLLALAHLPMYRFSPKRKRHLTWYWKTRLCEFRLWRKRWISLIVMLLKRQEEQDASYEDVRATFADARILSGILDQRKPLSISWLQSSWNKQDV